MPYTVSEFANEIRRKKNAYHDWPDDYLVNQYIQKYPEYESWVSFDPEGDAFRQSQREIRERQAEKHPQSVPGNQMNTQPEGFWEGAVDKTAGAVRALKDNPPNLLTMRGWSPNSTDAVIVGEAVGGGAVGLGSLGTFPADMATAAVESPRKIFQNIRSTVTTLLNEGYNRDAIKNVVLSNIENSVPDFKITEALDNTVQKVVDDAIEKAGYTQTEDQQKLGDIVRLGAEVATPIPGAKGASKVTRKATKSIDDITEEARRVAREFDIDEMRRFVEDEGLRLTPEQEATIARGGDPAITPEQHASIYPDPVPTADEVGPTYTKLSQEEAERFVAGQGDDLSPEERARIFRDGLTPEEIDSITPRGVETEDLYGVVGRSGYTQLERSGPKAAEAGEKLKYIDRQEAREMARAKQILDQVYKFPAKDQEDFSRLLGGELRLGEGANPGIEELYKVFKPHVMDDIGRRAEASRLRLMTPEGQSVPFKSREDYFPHYFEDAPQNDIFANPFEKPPDPVTGKAASGLQHVRTTERDDFIRDPKVLEDYLTGAIKRVLQHEEFGPDLQSAVTGIVDDVLKTDPDKAKHVRRILENSLGGKRWDDFAQDATSFAKNIQFMLKMPLAAMQNLSQFFPTFESATVGQNARAIRSILSGGDDAVATAIRSGATQNLGKTEYLLGAKAKRPANIVESKRIADILKNQLKKGKTGVYNFAEKGARGTAKYSGFTTTESGPRFYAAVAGHHRAKDLADIATGKSRQFTGFWGDATEKALRELSEGGVDIERFKKTGTLTKADLEHFANNFSRRSNFGYKEADVPVSWTNNSAGRLLTQFMGYVFQYPNMRMKRELWAKLKDGDPRPLLKWLTVTMPAAAGTVYTAEDAVKAKYHKLAGDWNYFNNFLAGLHMEAMKHPLVNAYYAWKYEGNPAMALGGPTVSTIKDTGMLLGRYMDSMAKKGRVLDRVNKTGKLMMKDVGDLFYEFDGPLADYIKDQFPAARTAEKHYDEINK